MSVESAKEPIPSPPLAGGREELERLFKEHNDTLLRYLRTILHSEQEARDVAQEAYVQVLGLRNASTVNFLRAYLFKTAANLAMNRVRDRRRRIQLDELALVDIAETGKSPEDEFLNDEVLNLISRKIDAMPPKVTKAFILIKFHGMDTAQAADIMGCSQRQVRRYVERAMEYCFKALREIEAGQP